MRILFVQRGHPYYTAELSSALASMGHDVGIVMWEANPDFVGTGVGDRNEEYRSILHPGVQLEFVRVPERTFSRGIGGNVSAIARMCKLMRRHKPDVLHLHDEGDYRIFAAAMLCRRRFPIVLTVHDARIHPGYSRHKAWFAGPWLRKAADCIIAHGSDIRTRLLAEGGVSEGKVFCIPHGPYTIYRRWMSAANCEEAKVLFFGRVYEYKGLDYLIRAAPIVRRQIPDATFVIAGSGPDWPRCKALIESPECFILREEKVCEPEVTKLFEEASVVVLPYVEASQSGVLMIAYALGKPVIVTNVGSLTEVVDDGRTGLVVPPRDEVALAGAIVRLLENEDLRKAMGAEGYAKATSGDLSWGSIAAKTTDVYEAAIAERTRT